MNQNLMKNFQVIGRCVKMQTLSLEDELRLLDGVPYDINFSQEASIKVPAGATLQDAPVSSIVEAIFSPPEVPSLPAIVQPPFDFDKVDRQIKKEEEKRKRRAKKRREKHPKRSPDEAFKDLCNMLKEWGIN